MELFQAAALEWPGIKHGNIARYADDTFVEWDGNKEEMMISYVSTNRYKGIIYGESSLKILDHTGKEVFHAKNTSYRNIQELKEFVDDFPNQRESLFKLYEELSK